MVKNSLAVVILNWRNAPDTIECLETLMRSSIPLHAIVCDNGSADGSVEVLLEWARGARAAPLRNPALRHLQEIPLAKPLGVDHRRPGDGMADGPQTPLTLIETGANLGYAGGNNVGLRFALSRPDIRHVWLLNNDTVVDRHAARHILDCFARRPELGLIGTDLRLYDDPGRFQMQGMMRFDRWSARAFGINAGRLVSERLPAEAVERGADFICGASMAASRAFLEDVGLLEERFFLYFEEIDWALRCRDRFALGYCPEAVVWHKEGASAGSASGGDARSPLSEYHLARSQRIFGAIHFPRLRLLWSARTLIVALKRLVDGRRAKAEAILRGMLGFGFSPPPSGR